MYLEYFGLHELPFSIAPNPRYLYLTQKHQEALAHLTYGLGDAGGVILLTGEVGTGKTTISRKILEEIPSHIDVAWIVNPRLSVEELLASICDELSIAYAAEIATVKVFTDLINTYLIDAHGQGRNVVLMIDEAQNLSPEVLEQLRLLTNLETSERKLLQIILLGQPELKSMLERTELRQLAQRITARYHLLPLSQDECSEYIRHRLAVGGCDRPVFSNKAVVQVFRNSLGIPRLINLLCDRALLGVYAANGVMVKSEYVQQATKEVMGEAVEAAKKSWLIPSVIAIVLLFTNIILLERLWPWLPNEQASVLSTGLDSEGSQIKHDTFVQTSVTVEEEKIMLPLSSPSSPQKLLHLQDSALAAPAVAVVGNVTMKILASPLAVSVKTKENPLSKTSTEVGANSLNAMKGDYKPVDTVRSVVEEFGAIEGDYQSVDAVWDVIEKIGSKRLAFQTLSAIWSRDMTAGEDHFCEQLKHKQLFCLQQRANSWLLREYNRPAIFQITGGDGHARYAVIRSVQKSGVVIQLDQQYWTVSVQDLELHWQGYLTLLWLKPPAYQGLIQVGDTGPMVTWLAKQLDEIQGEMIPVQKINMMDAVLVERIKAFQTMADLPADGVAGALTLIRMNGYTDANIPRLSQRELF